MGGLTFTLVLAARGQLDRMLLNLRDKDLEHARSQGCYPTHLAHLTAPEQILDRCIDLLEQLGFKTDVKRRDSKYSSTLFGHVWWGSNWYKKSPVQKAKVAVHETTHALQQSASKSALLRYPQPRQLWIAEVQAYGAGLCALKQMGFSYDEIVVEAKRNAASLWKDYFPVRLIRKKIFDKHTVKSLLSHAGPAFERLA